MMFPTVVACGCRVNYHPDPAYVGREPQPCLVVTRPCIAHKPQPGADSGSRAGMDDLAYRWAMYEAKRAFEAEEWASEPWRAPEAKRLHWPNSARWWHRLRGHTTRARYDFIVYSSAWECLDCEMTVGSIA